MKTVYVKLRDSGTSFYDIEQQAGVVSTRVAELAQTNKVKEFLRTGRLIEVHDESEAKAAIAKQDKEATQLKQTVADREKKKADEAKETKELAAETLRLKKEKEADEKKLQAKALSDARAEYGKLFKTEAPKSKTVEELRVLVDDEVARQTTEAQKASDTNPDGSAKNAAPNLDDL